MVFGEDLRGIMAGITHGITIVGIVHGLGITRGIMAGMIHGIMAAGMAVMAAGMVAMVVGMVAMVVGTAHITVIDIRFHTVLAHLRDQEAMVKEQELLRLYAALLIVKARIE